jgi:hypothetical protein
MAPSDAGGSGPAAAAKSGQSEQAGAEDGHAGRFGNGADDEAAAGYRAVPGGFMVVGRDVVDRGRCRGHG